MPGVVGRREVVDDAKRQGLATLHNQKSAVPMGLAELLLKMRAVVHQDEGWSAWANGRPGFGPPRATPESAMLAALEGAI